MSNETLAQYESLDLLKSLANEALRLWDIPRDCIATLIDVSENTTYIVENSDGFKAVLRVHRENYHSQRAIESELAWLDALADSQAVLTPGYFIGLDGSPVQQACIAGIAQPRYLVLFEFVDGDAPSEHDDIVKNYEELGAIAAACHNHALSWKKPSSFERFSWDTDSIFGRSPIWGNWRHAPGVGPTQAIVLEEVEKKIISRLISFGREPNRFNLIHADMRLANLLVGESGTRLIDFDDCGFGWFMYDFAAAVSFIEDDQRLPSFKASWLKGYQSIRPLNSADIDEMDTFIMLRRMALLAWIGSHMEAPEPQQLAPGFADMTAELGNKWLSSLT